MTRTRITKFQKRLFVTVFIMISLFLALLYLDVLKGFAGSSQDPITPDDFLMFRAL